MVNDYYDYSNSSDEDYDVLQREPLVFYSAIIVMSLYALSFIVGIPANIYVLFRMRRLARNDVERYRNGTGIALCSMAAADLCSLLLICVQNVHKMTITVETYNAEYMHYMCKAMLFLTHTITGISIWSWLLLSCLRYLAICHPLYHLRLWQMPYKALAFIVSMSAFLNVWLLFAVESHREGCAQRPLLHSLNGNRMLHLIEACWSFCIPCFVIIVMDTSVVIKSASLPRIRIGKGRRKSASAMEEIVQLTRTNSSRIKSFESSLSSQRQSLSIGYGSFHRYVPAVRWISRKHHNSHDTKKNFSRHQRALCKWLLIALVCILLNTPENTYRLVLLFEMPEKSSNDATQFAARLVSQALYFSQFAFNAIYLAVFVYDKSSRSKNVQDSNFNSHAVLQPMRSRLGSVSESPVVSHRFDSYTQSNLLSPQPRSILTVLDGDLPRTVSAPIDL